VDKLKYRDESTRTGIYGTVPVTYKKGQQKELSGIEETAISVGAEIFHISECVDHEESRDHEILLDEEMEDSAVLNGARGSKKEPNPDKSVDKTSDAEGWMQLYLDY
jgi:hypothetical protein